MQLQECASFAYVSSCLRLYKYPASGAQGQPNRPAASYQHCMPLARAEEASGPREPGKGLGVGGGFPAFRALALIFSNRKAIREFNSFSEQMGCLVQSQGGRSLARGRGLSGQADWSPEGLPSPPVPPSSLAPPQGKPACGSTSCWSQAGTPRRPSPWASWTPALPLPATPCRWVWLLSHVPSRVSWDCWSHSRWLPSSALRDEPEASGSTLIWSPCGVQRHP